MVLISSYGAPLAQRASYLAQHSSLIGPDGAVNYDYIITNCLLIGSRCIPNGTHTNQPLLSHSDRQIIIGMCWDIPFHKKILNVGSLRWFLGLVADDIFFKVPNV